MLIVIENKFDLSYKVEEAVQKDCGINEIEELYNKFHITDINFIKPGISLLLKALVAALLIAAMESLSTALCILYSDMIIK